ncbi:MAG: hypothetical protein JWL93_2652, partial [Hyphomicrobiales bacterium]|nr:hypothetical protein [Hyphomicrobiales bacterium]
MSRWRWLLEILSTRLWIRASVFGVLAVITALISIYVRVYIPEDVPRKIGADAVDGILNILASSMLAVTIFSVSTMVSAYGAATDNVTPRATKLLIEDKISHNALSTFIGAFIFSIVSIVALTTGAYGDAGRLVLFFVTVLVIFAIVVTLLRWVEYLSRLGRVNETIERVEDVTAAALLDRLAHPYLDATPRLSADVPAGCVPLMADRVAYVQHIDVGLLHEAVSSSGGAAFVDAMPGKLVHPQQPLAWLRGVDDEACLAQARSAFILDRERSFRQDPRFGMAVLSEIASRALSQAVNDPGTAIHVIGVGMRVLFKWCDRDSLVENEEIRFPAVHIPALRIEDLFDDFFSPIERDGAGTLEVGMMLQKAYGALALCDDAAMGACARAHSRRALQHCKAALRLEDDFRLIEARALEV